jgi:chemotaxis protein histidine kinase CheA
MNLDEALQTFIAESRELLEEMENALLNVDLAGDQSEAINAIFRAAHTIKGRPACSASITSSPSPTWWKACWTRCATAA